MEGRRHQAQAVPVVDSRLIWLDCVRLLVQQVFAVLQVLQH